MEEADRRAQIAYHTLYLFQVLVNLYHVRCRDIREANALLVAQVIVESVYRLAYVDG